MVFQERFIAVVKCGGKVLRERNKCEVSLPFGSEYSLLFKNLDSRRAVVKVSIDGTDILFGKSLIVEPNSELELERFLDKLTVGNKLKFIQKTKQISDHRGDRIDDGIIRIEYAFELPPKVVCNWNWTYTAPMYYPPSYSTTVCYNSRSTHTGPPIPFTEIDMSVSDGITVPGSKSQQSFSESYVGELGDPNVIVLVLKGDTGNISKPITTKTKLECLTCGTHHKSSMNFCPDCGTALVIY